MTGPSITVEQLADRLAIEDTLALYCRGIDRCDAGALHAVFPPDAKLDYGYGPQEPAPMIEGLLDSLSAMRLTQHNIGNVVCRIDGDSAKAETYCVALHIFDNHAGEETELVVGGRYLDTLAKRDGRWLIVERLYIMDWNRMGLATMQTSGGMFDALKRTGARKPDDPSCAWWQE